MFTAVERGHGGSIVGTNDVSCYIMMEKMSPQNCSGGGPASEAHDITIQSNDDWRVGGSGQHVPITFEFDKLLGPVLVQSRCGRHEPRFQPLRWSSKESLLRRVDRINDMHVISNSEPFVNVPSIETHTGVCKGNAKVW